MQQESLMELYKEKITERRMFGPSNEKFVVTIEKLNEFSVICLDNEGSCIAAYQSNAPGKFSAKIAVIDHNSVKTKMI
jgi:hypothetical protein